MQIHQDENETGVFVDALLTRIYSSSCTFNTVAFGLHYSGSNTANMSANQFSGTATQDIDCFGMNPNVTKGANNRRGTGLAMCFGCVGCPF